MGVLIIGTGLAGYSVAREVRKHDADLPITLLTSDDGCNYSKPMLSNGFAKGKSADGLRQQPAAQMAEALNAKVVAETLVHGIDTDQRTVTTSKGDFTYEKLVIAVGAKQIVLPLGGDAADAVMSVNTLSEYAHFRSQIESKKTVAVMGPGLIGCEFANDLVNGGLQCHVIGPDRYPLERLMPEPAGRAVQLALEAQGTRFHFETVVQSVDHAASGFMLSLSNGTQVNADAVLSAAGLAPDTALAKAAGIDVGRGIAVDRTLQTSVPGVYALGDCAEIEGMVMPYVMPIMHAARTLGATLTGTPTSLKLPAMPVAVKTPAHPVVVSPPAVGSTGAWRCESLEDGGVKALYEAEDGTLLGLALTGSIAVKQKVTLQRELPTVLD